MTPEKMERLAHIFIKEVLDAEFFLIYEEDDYTDDENQELAFTSFEAKPDGISFFADRIRLYFSCYDEITNGPTVKLQDVPNVKDVVKNIGEKFGFSCNVIDYEYTHNLLRGNRTFDYYSETASGEQHGDINEAVETLFGYRWR
jgi:hypothetical protein